MYFELYEIDLKESFKKYIYNIRDWKASQPCFVFYFIPELVPIILYFVISVSLSYIYLDKDISFILSVAHLVLLVLTHVSGMYSEDYDITRVWAGARSACP